MGKNIRKEIIDFEYDQSISKDLFKKAETVTRFAKKNDTIGKPLKTWSEISKKFFFNPYAIAALAILITILLLSLIFSVTSPNGYENAIVNTSNEEFNKLFIWATPSWHTPNNETLMYLDFFGAGDNVKVSTILLELGVKKPFKELTTDILDENGNTIGFRLTIQILDEMSGGTRYVLGLDSLGRDIWTRMWVAVGSTIMLTALIVLTEVTIGIILGSYLGFNENSIVDKIVMKFVKVIRAVPNIVWFVAIMFVLPDKGLVTLYLAFALFGWTESVKQTRRYVIEIKKKEFIQSAMASGVSGVSQVVNHAFPIITGRLIVMSLHRMNTVISIEVAMAMFGFVNNAHIPTLGTVLNEASHNLTNWWAFFYPSVVVFLWVLSMQFTARSVKQAFDFSSGGAHA